MDKEVKEAFLSFVIEKIKEFDNYEPGLETMSDISQAYHLISNEKLFYEFINK